MLIMDIKNNTLKIQNYFEIFQEKNNLDSAYKLKFFDKIFGKSVKRSLHSDVESCILLSGGLDSSLIVAKASELNSKINTFSVRNSNSKQFDETKFARFISDYYGTNHTEVDISEIKLDHLKLLAKINDNPIADPTILPTFLISKIVANNYKVAIGGDGADELFGGYNHYQKALYLILLKNFLPKFFTNKKVINNNFYKSKYVKVLHFLSNDISTELLLTKYFLHTENLFKDKSYSYKTNIKQKNIFDEVINKISYLDFNNYLPNNILTKNDRASMFNSLELRSPFLSNDIVKFAFNFLSSNEKVNFINKKVFLKKYAKSKLPKGFDFSRKQGFSINLIDFLKNKEFKNYINIILFSNNELFNEIYIKELYSRALKNNFQCAQLVYMIFVINQWMLEYQVKI